MVCTLFASAHQTAERCKHRCSACTVTSVTARQAKKKKKTQCIIQDQKAALIRQFNSCTTNTQTTRSDPSHPAHCLCQLLSSGRRCRSHSTIEFISHWSLNLITDPYTYAMRYFNMQLCITQFIVWHVSLMSAYDAMEGAQELRLREWLGMLSENVNTWYLNTVSMQCLTFLVSSDSPL